MATRGGRYPRAAGPEAAGPGGPGAQSPPQAQEDPRTLRRVLEARQRHLRARIAACEELTAEMAALRAALRADRRPPCAAPGPGPAPAPPGSLTRQAPGPAGASSAPGGEGGAEP